MKSDSRRNRESDETDNKDIETFQQRKPRNEGFTGKFNQTF